MTTKNTAMTVHITPEAHAQIMHYIQKATGEVSGLGRIIRDDKGRMIVHKVYLLDQENGATTTDIDDNALSKLLFETRTDAGDLNFWWHSHVNMGVFWSGTDMDTIKQFGSKGYIVATVFNKKGEWRSAYLQGGNDFLPALFIDDLDTQFHYVPSVELQNTWDAEFTAKCRDKKYAPVLGHTYFRHGWDGNDSWDAWGNDVGYYNNSSSYTKTPPDAKGIATNIEYMGTNSGLTQTEMIAMVKRWFYRSFVGTESLTVPEWLALCDVCEFIDGYEADEKDMEDMYRYITSSIDNMQDVCLNIKNYSADEDDDTAGTTPSSNIRDAVAAAKTRQDNNIKQMKSKLDGIQLKGAAYDSLNDHEAAELLLEINNQNKGNK